ncbi:hypothetical protein R1sor_022840 [Riccia sorocarpa]|uniref:50S ribosomal protein L12, chloroplastic n=1 Tax=Riccia sorocarpa TaxID=122646 RepID=A0ABD3GQ80_9MARC
MAMAAVASSCIVGVAPSSVAVSVPSKNTISLKQNGMMMGAPLRQFARVQTSVRRRAGVVRASVAEAEKVDVDQLVSIISKLTLSDARALTDKLQDVLGVTAAAFAPAAAGPAAPAEAAPVVEEKTEFDVILEEVPSNARIAVIKVIRSLTSLGLKEAKDLIDGLPKTVKEAVGKEDGEEAKKQLEAAGAKCSLKLVLPSMLDFVVRHLLIRTMVVWASFDHDVHASPESSAASHSAAPPLEFLYDRSSVLSGLH